MIILKRKPKQCVICETEYTPRSTTQKVCRPACAYEFVKRQNAKKALKQVKDNIKAEKRKNAKQKREFYANDIKTRKKAAKEACHAYIRARDWGKPCICCNRPFKPDFQAGHFLESGNNPKIRYDENNIHSQSIHCNMFKGGDSGEYETNLIIKIGRDKVGELKNKKGGTMKRTAQDYKAIEDYYKAKLLKLNNDQVDINKTIEGELCQMQQRNYRN